MTTNVLIQLGWAVFRRQWGPVGGRGAPGPLEGEYIKSKSLNSSSNTDVYSAFFSFIMMHMNEVICVVELPGFDG